jgi:hypothetical protein
VDSLSRAPSLSTAVLSEVMSLSNAGFIAILRGSVSSSMSLYMHHYSYKY